MMMMMTFWSFDRKILLYNDAKAPVLISAEMCEMCQLEMHAFHLNAFHFEMHKTADFHSILLVLATEGYPARPIKCAHYYYFLWYL